MQRSNQYNSKHFETNWKPHGYPVDKVWQFTQRIVAAVLLTSLLPLLSLLILIVKLTSKGPFLYSQERLGINRKPFKAYKIRTMIVGADKNKSFARSVQLSNPCITPVGRILRELKLDELPQLWNIVKGDMVFVGPRPIAISLQQELEQSISGFKRRLSIPPGLTNLGQVCILENTNQDRVVEDWKMRFEAELHYIKNRKPSYDILVLLITVLYVMRKVLSRFKSSRLYSPKGALISTVFLLAIVLSGCSSVATTTAPNSAVVSIKNIKDTSNIGLQENIEVESISLQTAEQGEPDLHRQALAGRLAGRRWRGWRRPWHLEMGDGPDLRGGAVHILQEE